MITKLYAQTDWRWAHQPLGYNTDHSFNLGNYGCVVTAYGNMLCAVTGDMQYTPAMINDYMQSHNGFMPNGGLFIWDRALGLGHVEAHGTTSELANLNSWLSDPPNFALLEVRTNKGMQHFVMAPYVDKIVDSEDGLLKNMGTYPFIKAHLYRSTEPVKEPVPAPPAPSPSTGTVTVIAKPFLNLRTSPEVRADNIGHGLDGNGHIIYSLPTGAVVGYADRVSGQEINGNNIWYKSIRGNYFWSGGCA